MGDCTAELMLLLAFESVLDSTSALGWFLPLLEAPGTDEGDNTGG